jgi:hypothetical protein
MTSPAERLEREIAEGRARLGRTLGALGRKLSPGGLADELAGSVRQPFLSLIEDAYEAARRNPLPVMLMAAGAGLLVYEMRKDRARIAASKTRVEDEPDIPVLNTGRARLYDPDAPLHPTQAPLASHRGMGARA